MCSFNNVMGSLVKASFSGNVFKLEDFVISFLVRIESLIVRNEINILCFVYIYF